MDSRSIRRGAVSPMMFAPMVDDKKLEHNAKALKKDNARPAFSCMHIEYNRSANFVKS